MKVFHGFQAFRKSPGVLLACIVCLTGCHHRSKGNSPAVPYGDSVRLLGVKQQSEKFLTGHEYQLKIQLVYNLVTRDTAWLTLFVDEFNNQKSCLPDSPDNASPISIVAGSVALVRGIHTVDIPVVWRPARDSSKSGDVVNSGTMTFHTSLADTSVPYSYQSNFFGTSYCLQFNRPN